MTSERDKAWDAFVHEPVAQKALTLEALEEVMDELFTKARERPPFDPSMLTTEQRKMWEARGVMAVDTSVWFTEASKARCDRALETEDFSELNEWELAAMRLLRVIEGVEE